MNNFLTLNQINLHFGAQAIVSNLSFSLQRGEIGALLGASGCGKTTLLRAIAGLEPLHSGEIHLDGTLISGAGVAIPPQRRGIGMVFQDYALFPHLTVAGNIAFGLHGESKSHQQRRVEEMLALVGLEQLGRRYIHELSGGQQQRVAIARALAPQPRLLLLDEPFSNLDVELRERLGQEVRSILKRSGTTAILVTHDQHEAFAVADQIGLMHAGEIAQWGSAEELYHHPKNAIVANFIGDGVLFSGTLRAHNTVHCALGDLNIEQTGEIGKRVELLLRPHHIECCAEGELTAQLINKAFRGNDNLYTLALPSGETLLALVNSEQNHPLGASIRFKLNSTPQLLS